MFSSPFSSPLQQLEPYLEICNCFGLSQVLCNFLGLGPWSKPSKLLNYVCICDNKVFTHKLPCCKLNISESSQQFGKVWHYVKPCAHNTRGSRRWLLNTVYIFETWFSSYTGTPHTPKGEGVSVSLVADIFQCILWYFPVHGNPSLAAECVLISLSDPSLQDFAHCPSCSRKHFR